MKYSFQDQDRYQGCRIKKFQSEWKSHQSCQGHDNKDFRGFHE